MVLLDSCSVHFLLILRERCEQRVRRVKILLADDHALFRDSLCLALKTIFPECTIVCVGSWREANAQVGNKYFDLLLLDLLMPGNHDCWESGLIQVMRHPYGAICIISSSNNRAHIRQAFELGVNGYICKTLTLAQMEVALQKISQGRNYLPQQLISSSTNPITYAQRKRDKTITQRQREILELLAAGDSNRVIAEKLELTESTIKRHIYNLYKILGAKSRTDAIRIGRRHRLLT